MFMLVVLRPSFYLISFKTILFSESSKYISLKKVISVLAILKGD